MGTDHLPSLLSSLLSILGVVAIGILTNVVTPAVKAALAGAATSASAVYLAVLKARLNGIDNLDKHPSRALALLILLCAIAIASLLWMFMTMSMLGFAVEHAPSQAKFNPSDGFTGPLADDLGWSTVLALLAALVAGPLAVYTGLMMALAGVRRSWICAQIVLIEKALGGSR